MRKDDELKRMRR